jgi:hypothetical protein
MRIPSRRNSVPQTTALIVWLAIGGAATAGAPKIAYDGDGADLQKVIDAAEAAATIACNPKRKLELSRPVTIKKALALEGLHAGLPTGLGKTSLIVVEAQGVTLRDCELHGNYDSVPQKDRAPLVWFQAGKFTIERCTFHDASKDGVMITPRDEPGANDIVGGAIRDIKGFRLGRDAVSISGGNKGQKVRNVTVDNVRLEKSYHRGAVEVSDGTDDITVRNVYAQDAVYAIDVQDHGKGSAANTNVQIENVEAVRCKHLIRTANSPRGHANLTLKNFTARECTLPVLVTNTKNVRIEELRILAHTHKKQPPVRLQNCDGVVLKALEIESRHFRDRAVETARCTNVKTENPPP